MSSQDDAVEMVIEYTTTIIELNLEEAPLRDRLAQIEAERAEMKSRIARLIAGEHPPSLKTAEASTTRRKRPFAGTGFIGVILKHLREHPGEEVSPESAAAAVGHPERNGLAGTCLKRLHDAGLVAKPRTGRYVYYVYLDPQPFSPQAEAAMT